VEGVKAGGRSSREAKELLGMLKGLKYSGYSKAAIDAALGELEAKTNELLRNPKKNLDLIGLYLALLRLIEEENFEGAEEFLRKVLD